MIPSFPDALPVGTKLLQYRIIKVLGQGNFGLTYLAQDTRLNMPVAIKEFFPQQVATRKANGDLQPKSSREHQQVPGGCFQMGSNSGVSDEKPVHEVCVDGFWMGKYEVTQGQWQKVMGDNPSEFKKGLNHPVEGVSWIDSQKFFSKWHVPGSGQFRLPTEAEWEYACRSGGKSEEYSGGNNADPVACYGESKKRGHHPVGGKAPNGLGLFDMSGNVWEWVQDTYSGKAYQQHSRQNPMMEESDSVARVTRGGSWFYNLVYTRCTNRVRAPDHKTNFMGFRAGFARPRR